jgi:hypothetical protein
MLGGAFAALAWAFATNQTAEAKFASAVAVCLILGCMRLIGRGQPQDPNLRDSE